MVIKIQTITHHPMQRLPMWKEGKEKIHSLHYLCSRVCAFPPAMPRYFINNFSKPGDTILDPWSGRGTAPLEAVLNNRVGIGNDRSPEAYVLTRAKVNPPKIGEIENYLADIKRATLSNKKTRTLTEFDRKAKIFYGNSTFNQILNVKELLADDNSKVANFTKAVLLGILHGSSQNALSLQCSHSYSMSPAYVKKYAKEKGLRRPSKNVISEVEKRARIVLTDPVKNKGIALNNDSQNLDLKNSSVNMVFGSPPYFDVQTYAWCNWLRLWFLGHDYRDVKRMLCETGSKEKYAEFMQNSINELHRVLKNNGDCFIIAGDVKIGREKKTLINTVEFLRPLFENAGFDLNQVMQEKIPSNRKVLTYINSEQGVKIERIAHFIKE